MLGRAQCPRPSSSRRSLSCALQQQIREPPEVPSNANSHPALLALTASQHEVELQSFLTPEPCVPVAWVCWQHVGSGSPLASTHQTPLGSLWPLGKSCGWGLLYFAEAKSEAGTGPVSCPRPLGNGRTESPHSYPLPTIDHFWHSFTLNASTDRELTIFRGSPGHGCKVSLLGSSSRN